MLRRIGRRAIAAMIQTFGEPAPQCARIPPELVLESAQLLATPRLRWVHLSSAWYSVYDRDDIRRALAAQGARLGGRPAPPRPFGQHRRQRHVLRAERGEIHDGTVPSWSQEYKR